MKEALLVRPHISISKIKPLARTQMAVVVTKTIDSIVECGIPGPPPDRSQTPKGRNCSRGRNPNWETRSLRPGHRGQIWAVPCPGLAKLGQFQIHSRPAWVNRSAGGSAGRGGI